MKILDIFAVSAAVLTGVACDGRARSENDEHGDPAAAPNLLIDREERPLIFGNPEDCERCHAQHFAEWSTSNHAYALTDPVFRAMVKVGQEQTKGKLGQFCIQCHSPVGMAMQETIITEDSDGVFAQELVDVSPVAAHGVSCDVCHSITDVIEPLNARAILTPDGTRRGTIEDPVSNEAHASAYSALHESSDLCGMCHSVTNPKGALVEETFDEWATSSFAEDGGKTCQDCHMPEYEGRATPDAPLRTLHRHRFVGVDVSLVGEDEFPGYWEIRYATAQLLRSAVDFSAYYDSDSSSLRLVIKNLAGHALPSGATAERQMWVALEIRDAKGKIVVSSGELDKNGDLFDGVEGHSTVPRSDPQLIYYGQQLVDVAGIDKAPDDDAKSILRTEGERDCRPMGEGAVAAHGVLTPVSFPWQATWQCNYLIPADGADRPGYQVAALPPGDYTAQLTLRFRSFPPYFLRELEKIGDLDPIVKTRVPIVDMASTRLSFEVRR